MVAAISRGIYYMATLYRGKQRTSTSGCFYRYFIVFCPTYEKRRTKIRMLNCAGFSEFEDKSGIAPNGAYYVAYKLPSRLPLERLFADCYYRRLKSKRVDFITLLKPGPMKKYVKRRVNASAPRNLEPLYSYTHAAARVSALIAALSAG